LFLYRYVLEKDLEGSIDSVRAKKPRRLPTVLTKEEVFGVIGFLSGTHRLMAKLLYGSGLRSHLAPAGSPDPAAGFEVAPCSGWIARSSRRATDLTIRRERTQAQSSSYPKILRRYQPKPLVLWPKPLVPLVLRHLSCTAKYRAQGLRALSQGQSGQRVQGPGTKGTGQVLNRRSLTPGPKTE